MMTRRGFLATGAGLLGTALLSSSIKAEDTRPRRIVLVSSWQMINIGDIGHTPGALKVLEQHAPSAEVTLWARSMNDDVRAILNKRFPKVKIVQGSIDEKKMEIKGDELKKALNEMDLLMHSSGPSVVAANALKIARELKKPYGVFGVTLAEIPASARDLYSGASFFFCRDTQSLKALKESGATCPVMEFTPDAASEIDLLDEERATEYLKKNDLKEREFLCAIPRLRYTPYHRIDAEERKSVSDKFVEVDHAKLREAVIAWVEKTGKKVLICPEMTYQLEICKKYVYEPLPEAIKKNCVLRKNYWWPDEACSVYKRARAVLSFEMHSPLFAISNNTPAIYLRQPTDTRKGQMMRDFGLEDWIFEIDDTTGAQISERVLKIDSDYPVALEYLKKGRELIAKRHAECMEVVRKAAGMEKP